MDEAFDAWRRSKKKNDYHLLFDDWHEKDLRALVRSHGWRFPVAYDHDGILANLLGVAVCPLIVYALPGGIVRESTVGEIDGRALDHRLDALEQARG